jgi:uncharacterized membrane protein YdjX (TVP38/TMEM64 family)
MPFVFESVSPLAASLGAAGGAWLTAVLGLPLTYTWALGLGFSLARWPEAGLGGVAVAAGAALGATTCVVAIRAGERRWGRGLLDRLAKLPGLRTLLAASAQGQNWEGSLTLAALRLLPIAPALLVNLAFAATPMTLRRFASVTALASLPQILGWCWVGVQMSAALGHWQQQQTLPLELRVGLWGGGLVLLLLPRLVLAFRKKQDLSLFERG